MFSLYKKFPWFGCSKKEINLALGSLLILILKSYNSGLPIPIKKSSVRICFDYRHSVKHSFFFSRRPGPRYISSLVSDSAPSSVWRLCSVVKLDGSLLQKCLGGRFCIFHDCLMFEIVLDHGGQSLWQSLMKKTFADYLGTKIGFSLASV